MPGFLNHLLYSLVWHLARGANTIRDEYKTFVEYFNSSNVPRHFSHKYFGYLIILFTTIFINGDEFVHIKIRILYSLQNQVQTSQADINAHATLNRELH
jgi:hypothetical protein